jgi:hypothetical protein
VNIESLEGTKKGTGGMAQVVECLPSKCEAHKQIYNISVVLQFHGWGDWRKMSKISVWGILVKTG